MLGWSAATIKHARPVRCSRCLGDGADDEDEGGGAEDGGEAAGAVKVGAASTDDEARKQAAADAEQYGGGPCHRDFARIEEAGEDADEEAGKERAEKIDHGAPLAKISR